MPSLTPPSKPHPAGSPAKATMTAPPQAPTAKPKKNWVLIGGGAGALLVLVGAFIVWQKMTAPPRLNDSTLDIAKFAASGSFDGLSLTEQRKYMQVLEGRKDDVKELYHAGKISEPEYRTAKELFWFSDWLGRMDEYYSKSPGQQRQDYLNTLAAKQDKKDDDEDDKKPGNKSSGGPKLPKVKRDELSEKTRPEKWTADDQKRWKEFRSAYAQVKEARDKAAKEKEAARPATRPG